VFFGFDNDLFGADKDVKDQLRKSHMQLLMEKGICDDQGTEIE
jgi:hypothetical protein